MRDCAEPNPNSVPADFESRKPFFDLQVDARDLATTGAASLVLVKFHGSVPLLNLGLIICLAAVLARNISERDYGGVMMSVGVAVLILLWPEVSLLHAIWPLVLPKRRIFFPICFVSLLSGCLEYFQLGNFPFSVIYMIAALSCGTFLAFLSRRWRAAIILFLLSASLGLTLFDLGTATPSSLSSLPQLDIPFGYRTGETASRVIGSPKDGKIREVRSLLQGESPAEGAQSILLIEHDQWTGHPAEIAPGNWHQPEPWNENQLLGNQFWLAAIRADKQFQSNLGGQAIANGRVLLLSPTQLASDACLAADRGNTLYLGDSDYFCNGMAAYQPNLLNEIFGNPLQYVRIRVLSCLLLVAALLHHISTFFRIPFLSFGLLVGTAFCAPCMTVGDVRVKGRVFDPHEPSRASGAAAALSDGGICAIFGEKQASVLVVAEGESAALREETIVLLEPNSTVLIGNLKIGAAEIPLGVVDEVIDARALIVNEIKQEAPAFTAGAVKVIGTGSPSKNIVKLWPLR